MRGIVLFAHGARDAEWARPFEAIRRRVNSARPEFPVEVAYLEHMSPRLDEAVASLVAQGASSIRVFPLFMAQGGHLKNDLPKMVDAIRAEHPHVPIALETAIGDSPELLDCISRWVLSRAE